MKKSKKEEFNGYGFEDKKNRSKMKYVVIIGGDLDLNGAYAFKNKKNLKDYIENEHWRGVYAIFKVKDITTTPYKDIQ